MKNLGIRQTPLETATGRRRWTFLLRRLQSGRA